MPRPIDSLSVFLTHALAIEHEATERYAEFAASFAERGEPTLAGICSELARAEGEHYARLVRAAEGVELAPLRAGEYCWIEAGVPEAPARDAFYRIATPAQLLQVALEAEKRARRFFAWVARTTRDRTVRLMAREIATEEAQHVAWIEKAIAYRDPAPVAEPPLPEGLVAKDAVTG
jgi:rubrerythrin